MPGYAPFVIRSLHPHDVLECAVERVTVQELDLSSPLSASGQRNVHVLACGHRYHDLYDMTPPLDVCVCVTFRGRCLRGWAMVGKKDTCAYCREKIDLKDVSTGFADFELL